MVRSRFTPTLLALVALGACSPLFSKDDAADPVRVGFVSRHGAEVNGTGTVEWIAEQGGFFAIRGADGQLYDPINLPPALARAGTRVRFAARLSEDLNSFQTLATAVELERIARE